MKSVITSERIPIKLWLDDIEEGALKQAKDIANLPFAFHHVAIMPDAHQGYGMPIGGVLATRGAVVPNAVGVDIGCGVCIMRTNLPNPDKDELKTIMSQIRDKIPLGFSHHPKPQEWAGFDHAPDIPIIKQELDHARYQLGTLGGGNHFIEIQRGSDDKIYVMLHSGSRNFGLKIANEYHKKAVAMCEKHYSDIPDKELAFFPIETPEAREYFEAMDYAKNFAKYSRILMMQRIKATLPDVFHAEDYKEITDVVHNYAQYENHFRKNVIVHRKGAILAPDGQTGLIPGSQGTKSFIVSGKGNPDSFYSCSHGAGRRMGRKQAIRELDLAEEVKRLDDAGVIHGIRTEKDLDEAAGAYKDINAVMENQKDLAEIHLALSPLAVIKA